MTDPMPMNDKGPKVPPTCPPRTPPPQKKPVEAPRSQPSTKPVTSLLPLPGPQQARLDVRRPRMAIQDRRAANWALTAYPWTATQAVGKVTETVRAWGYAHPADDVLEQAVRLLVDAATADEGRRISVHLADQDGMLLVVGLSHAGTSPDDTILTDLAAVPGTASCGTDASDEGRRVWTVLSTERPRFRATPAA
ncbi:hypothetical protein [Streptomyces zaomyceticus]|uniref:hypothetical protein n=1 Tax=Streptomyces zaomyceticus TaxID=68286 RepID=UPI002E0D48A5|nr:hypothetical protein OG237_42690 [Streptomyces zaomyceticus]